MRRRSALLALSGLAITQLAGCSMGPRRVGTAIRYFDLGPPLTVAAGCDLNVRLGKISASPALQGSRMWYRHDEAPYEPRAYAVSRWSAAPAVLIHRHLQASFAKQPQTHLDIDILRLELQLDRSDRGLAVVELDTSLRTAATSSSLRYFKLEQPCPASPAGCAGAIAQVMASWRDQLCETLAVIDGASTATPAATVR